MSLNVKRKRISVLILSNLLVLTCLTIVNNSIFAEGSKEISPGVSDRTYLYLNGELYNSFGRYDGNADQRLFFHIANPNQEQVYLGFSQSVSSGHYPCRGVQNISYFRIKDPDGNIVYPRKGDQTGQVLNATTANISSKSEAQIGPTPIAGNGGYSPFVFDPSGLPSGNYYIEFSSISNIPTPNIVTAIEHWDITVATKDSNPTAIDGRVFAINWSFYAPSISCDPMSTYGWFDRPFNGQFYVLSQEGFVNLVDFKDAGFQPAAFNLYFNDTGTNNSGNPIEDRKSVVGLGQNQALHKIFLNNPDPVVYPSGVYGTLDATPELHLCETTHDGCIMVTPTTPGQIEVLIDFDTSNGSFIYDVNTRDVLIVYNITPEQNEISPYQRCIPWDGKDGLGNYVSSLDVYDMEITFQQGVYHLPIYDVEYFLKGVKTTNVRPIPTSGDIVKKLYFDDSNIPFLPGNGEDKTQLNGCLSPCHSWSIQEFGDEHTINSWFFADVEKRIKGEIPHCLIEANDDIIVTQIETATTIPVLTNDVGSLIDTGSIELITSTDKAASITIATDGTITYTPINGFIGIDSFKYSICYDVIPKNSFCDDAYVYVKVGEEIETDCSDGIDNDFDGLIDCDDTDCRPATPPDIIRKKK